MNGKLWIYRGLQGSGKSTLALACVAEAPDRRARINRDTARIMTHGGRLGTRAQEAMITRIMHASLRELLAAGVEVYCDDMNLVARQVRDLVDIAVAAGAEYEFVDLSRVPLATCIARDANREPPQRVGEAVIREKYERHIRPLRGQGFPPVLPSGTARESVSLPKPYVPPVDAPEVVLCDLDGTAALMCDRSPYPDGEHLVGGDSPNPPVVAALRAFSAAGLRIVFMSARTEGCRDLTEAWLSEHVGVPYDALIMRPVGDTRRDAEVKLELFDQRIRHAYRVVCVLDDRDQVVRMWRSIGLSVFQVAEGGF